MKNLILAVKETSEILKENEVALFFREAGKVFSLSLDGDRYCLYRACSNGEAGDFKLLGKARYFKTEAGLNRAIAAHL